MIRTVPIAVLSCLVLLCIWSGCVQYERSFYSGPGKKPVYTPLSELTDIKNEAPKPIQLSGTIFLKDTLLFILEQRKGIHVFSLQDTSNTVNLAFIKIPAVTDFVVSGSLIYADCWKDLVVIDISDLYHIRETSRIKNAITPVLYPLLYNGIFECADESKGAIIDWEDAMLEDAKCVTIN